MSSEAEDLLEHLERYRSVTLQHLDMLSDADLGWRPRPDAFSMGQHFVHILQSEDFFVRGLFENDWNMERLRFPGILPSCAELRSEFAGVRLRTRDHFAVLADATLGVIIRPAYAKGVEGSMRSWLWFIVEHEIHHKAQLAEYFRTLGRVPPYFAIPLPAGVRPDIAARAELGGI